MPERLEGRLEPWIEAALANVDMPDVEWAFSLTMAPVGPQGQVGACGLLILAIKSPILGGPHLTAATIITQPFDTPEAGVNEIVMKSIGQLRDAQSKTLQAADANAQQAAAQTNGQGKGVIGQSLAWPPKG